MAEIEVTREHDAPPVVERTGFRLSWGAVFAGFIAATMLHVTLSLLGVAVGFTTWDVGDPARDLGLGVGLWMAISALVAFWVGGMTAGRLAGVLTRGDGALHGLLVWGVATLVNLWLLGTAAGVVVGGAFGVLRSAVDATVSAAAGGVGAVGSAALQEVDGADLDVAALRREVEAALEATGDPALRPDSLGAELGEVRGEAASGASNAAIAGEIVERIRATAGEVDREDVVRVIVDRTGMSRAEAERAADRIESAAASARSGIASGARRAGEAAEDVATTGVDLAGRAAWWALLGLGLSLGAATLGAAGTARG